LSIINSGTHDAVKTECEGSGGTLIDVQSIKEIKLLFEYAKTQIAYDFYHVGGISMEASKKKYRWENGAPFNFLLFANSDGFDANQKYVAISATNLVDISSSSEKPGICEGTLRSGVTENMNSLSYDSPVIINWFKLTPLLK